MKNRRSKRSETVFEVMKYDESHESTATGRPAHIRQNKKHSTPRHIFSMIPQNTTDLKTSQEKRITYKGKANGATVGFSITTRENRQEYLPAH